MPRRHLTAILTLGATIALTGCTPAAQARPPAAATVTPTRPPLPPGLSSEEALHASAQAKSDAMTSTNVPVAASFVDPGCDADQREQLIDGVTRMKNTLTGAILTVTQVKVDGDWGTVNWHLDGTPSPGFMRIFAAAGAIPDRWHLVDGQWYQAEPECSGAPSTHPARS